MYYGGQDIYPNMNSSVPLSSYVSSGSSSHITYFDSFGEITFYYTINSPTSRYLFLSFPEFYGDKVEIGVYNGLPLSY